MHMLNKHYLAWHGLLALIVLFASLLPMVLSGRAGTLSILWALFAVVVLPPMMIWIMRQLGYPVGKAVVCPRCGTEMPLFRRPTSIRQGLMGGYTCPNCGTEMDA